MPQIIANGKTFEVSVEANLRQALLDQEIEIYSEGAKVFNCHGHGSCGTCIIQVEGLVSESNNLEIKRMSYPPHSAHKERRLACQVKVLGNIHVTRFDGYFGEGEKSIWTPEFADIAVSNS